MFSFPWQPSAVEFKVNEKGTLATEVMILCNGYLCQQAFKESFIYKDLLYQNSDRDESEEVLNGKKK
ncbi:hypothetical protein AKJ16_DCAP02714 [Drosera capensis]